MESLYRYFIRTTRMHDPTEPYIGALADRAIEFGEWLRERNLLFPAMPASLVARLEAILPATFYAGASLEFRIKRMVEDWQRAVKVNQELETRFLPENEISATPSVTTTGMLAGGHRRQMNCICTHPASDHGPNWNNEAPAKSATGFPICRVEGCECMHYYEAPGENRLMKCAHCGEPMIPYSRVRVSGKTYHADCAAWGRG